MQALTGLVAFFASCIILFARPAYGMAAYTAVLIWYPLKLTIKMGTVDLSASRIVILALLFNLLVLSGHRLKQFRFIALDGWVLGFFMAQFFSGIITAADSMAFLINHGSNFFDLILPYFAFRLFLLNYEDFVKYINLFFLTAIPYMVVGLSQFLTGNNLYTPLLKYAAWGGQGDAVRQRLGFYRTYNCMPVHILYGIFFMQATAFVTCVYHSWKDRRMLWWIGLGCLILGVFTSLSSGPYLALVVFGGFLYLYRIRRYWRPMVIVMLLIIGFVEVASNRHFYDVISRFTLNSASAWYRSRLMDVALFEGGMSGHWLLGHGFDVDPGWSAKIDRRNHTDIVNHYLVVLSRFGLVGLAPFFGILVTAYRALYRAFRRARDRESRWMVWSLFSGLSALLVVFFTVSLFGQPQTFFYILLAFCGTSPLLAASRNQLHERMKLDRLACPC